MPFPNPDTQFKPGWKGGPGRPKRKLLSNLVNDALAKDDGALAAAIVEAWLREVKGGSFSHLKELLDRTEGKVADILIGGHREKVEKELGDEDEADPTPAGPPAG